MGEVINVAYKLSQMWLPESKYGLKASYPMTPQGIVVHNTAGASSARAEATNMLNNNSAVSYHVIADESEVIELVPFSRNCWHAGDGSNGFANRNLIGIEIARSMDYSDDKYDRAEANAVEYIAWVCVQYGWTSANLHQHNWYSSTACPHRLKDHWNTFKRKVDERIAEINENSAPTHPSDNNEPSEWAADAWAKAIEMGLLDGTRPHEAVTREELAAVFVRLSEK